MSMDEKVDLEPERKREILELEARLDKNHFEVLGLSAAAGSEDARNAFRELSRKFHPDRYFGKNLGSFRVRLDKIFKRLVEANQTLSDDTKRRAYLHANPVIRAQARAGGGFQATEARSPEDEAREAERRARLARHPYLLKVSRTQEYVQRAREAIGKKEFSQAFTHLNQAAQADPNNAEVKALLAEVRRQNDQQRAEGNYKHAVEALNRGDEALALQAFKSAAAAGHAVAAFKAADLLGKSGGDLRERVSLGQKAVELDPTNVEYRLSLANLLEQANMKALAKKHLDEAQRLAPDDPEVKKQGKKRWPF